MASILRDNVQKLVPAISLLWKKEQQGDSY